MNAEDLARVRSAYADALCLPVAEREGFLRSRFADSPELLDQVRDLIRSNDECGEFLSKPLADLIIDWTETPKSRRVGPYELIEELGRGGSASVYRGRKTDDPLQKDVAVKVLNRLSHSEETFLRFQREIAMLKRVEHEYIVRLLDSGTTAENLAYIVTELIEGEHLDRFAASLPLLKRLSLFLKVCEGVSAAHRNLVVHRDLKPSNILVTPGGTPKLLDFGVAILIDSDFNLTQTGYGRMTVSYASPEQLRGDKRITTASDVYSLGVLLYETISGSQPFAFPKDQFASRNRTHEPVALEGTPRELRAIVRKAMQQEPDERYVSVDRLRDDLQSFLDGSPVLALSTGTPYRIWKLTSKHWLPLAGTLLAILALTSLSAVSIVSSREANRQSARVKELLTKVLGQVSVGRDNRLSLRTLRLVDEARLSYFNALGQEYPNDFQIAMLRFQTGRTLGVAQGLPSTLNLGETEKARGNLENAVQAGEAILSHWPGGADFKSELATTYLELGSTLIDMDKREEAQSKFDRAEMLLRSIPEGAGARAHLEALAQKSRLLVFSGRLDEALQMRREIVERRRELFAKNPIEVRWEYAGGLCSYGALLRRLGQLSEAEQAYALALPMIEELAAGIPRTFDSMWHAGREHEEYAKVLIALSRGAQAEKHLRRAIGLFKEILTIEPDAASNQRALAVCLNLMGSQLALRGDRAGGGRLVRQALIISRRAARLDPGSFRAQQEVAEIQKSLSRFPR